MPQEEKDRRFLELFKKITYLQFLTDFSSMDYCYPPTFIFKRFPYKNFFKKNSADIRRGKYGLYIHFPYCAYKCIFCRQFSSAITEKALYHEYVDLIEKEIGLYAPYFRRSFLTNVYFGGGTPTLFNLEKVLKAIYNNFKIDKDFQLNIEATPDSLDRSNLVTLKKMGLTRLLIGIQSFDPRVLEAINRPTNQLAVFKKVYHLAQKANIAAVNVELIAGLPRQSMVSFIQDLKYIINLKPASIHIYMFLKTPLTVLGRKEPKFEKGDRALRDKMYDIGARILADNNYFFRGDDFSLSDKERNPQLSAAGLVKNFKGIIGLGLSAYGYIPFENLDIATLNTFDLQEYKEKLKAGYLPIKKYYKLGQEERLRKFLIRRYRYDNINAELLRKIFRAKGLTFRELVYRFKKEFSFLERMGKLKINLEHETLVFNKEGLDGFIYSKAFYSSKVLKECQQIIDSRYQDIRVNLDFL